MITSRCEGDVRFFPLLQSDIGGLCTGLTLDAGTLIFNAKTSHSMDARKELMLGKTCCTEEVCRSRPTQPSALDDLGEKLLPLPVIIDPAVCPLFPVKGLKMNFFRHSDPHLN